MSRYNTATLANAPQQRRSLVLSLRILGAAEKILRREGWAALTMREVAAESGVTVGGIYRRFTDREELLQAVHAHVLERLVSRVGQAVVEARSSSLREVITAFVTSLAEGLRENRNIFPSISAKPSERVYKQALRAQEELYDALVAATMQHRSAIRRNEPDLALRVLQQMVTATFLRRISLGSSFGIEAEDWTALADELAFAAYNYLTAPPLPD